MNEDILNKNYQNIILTFEELANLISLKSVNSEELGIYKRFRNLSNNSIAIRQTSNQMKFIKIMKNRFHKLCKRSKISNFTRKDFRMKYFRIKAEETKKYILKNLQTRSYKNTKAKIILLYLKNKGIMEIHNKLKVDSLTIIDYLNGWQEQGFDSLKKKINERNIVSEKERIERSLIGRIYGKKAKAILDYKKEKKIQDIAKKYNVSRQTISKWLKDYKEKGRSSLYIHNTRKTILTDRDKKIVIKILKEIPSDFKKAYEQISNELNKKFTDRTLRNFIKKHNIGY